MKKSSDFKNFSNRLQYLRKQWGLKQSELADKLGLSSNTQISRFESGNSVPDTAILAKIADLFEVDLHWLITGNPSPGTENWRKNFAELARIANTLITFENDRLERERADFNKQLIAEQEKESRGEGTSIERTEWLKEAITSRENALSRNSERQHWIFERLYGEKESSDTKTECCSVK